MASKELIEVANVVATRKGRAWEWDWELLESAETLARHIMATVREDDDEPVTASWFSLLLGSIDRFEFGSTYCVEMNEVDQWEVWLYGHCMREIKTRGQFRQLCRGLGIELKESDQ